MATRDGLTLLIFLALASVVLEPVRAAEPAVSACVAVSVGKAQPEKRCIVPGSGATVWFQDCPACPQMVVVPAGSFNLGEGKPEALPGEKPQRAKIPKPFAVARFAVTFAEWDACVAAGGCNAHRPDDMGWGRGSRPVINVNWADAAAYLAWLSAATGKTYRLLTETEREYVARAGTTTPYWWGSDISLEQANYDVPVPGRRMVGVDYSEIKNLRRRTVPVDSFAANPWGLYNVHGNVWEWTADCWREPAPQPTPPRQRASAAACGERAARGGSWNDFAVHARSAARIGYNATARNHSQGFRAARNLP